MILADPSATRAAWLERQAVTPGWMRRPITPVVDRVMRRRAWCAERRAAAARCWSVVASMGVLLIAFWVALP